MFRIIFVSLIVLTGCNSVYYKPATLDKNDVIYVDRGGFAMQHEIKQRLQKRGYKVTVGHKKSTINSTYVTSEDASSILSTSDIGGAKYIIQITEKTPKFKPFWCFFNGFWWWNFNVSIADNKTGQEILGWSGRGCENSSLRKLDSILDQMEIK